VNMVVWIVIDEDLDEMIGMANSEEEAEEIADEYCLINGPSNIGISEIEFIPDEKEWN